MKKRNPTKKERELAAEYQRMVAKWEAVPKFSKTKLVIKPLENLPTATKPVIRETPRLQSRTTPGGQALKKAAEQYTGTEMIGVAQMHKSNAVPVFNSKAAVELAQMRRS